MHADSIHTELSTLLEEIYNEGKEDKILSVDRLVEPVIELISACNDSNAILRIAVRLKRGEYSFASHSLNVAIVSIKIGLSRGFSRERLSRCP